MTVISENENVTHDSYDHKMETSVIISGNKTRRFSSNQPVSADGITADGNIGDNQYFQKMPTSPLRGFVIMTACMYITMSGFGMMSALGVVYVELISAFQCLRSEAALVQSLYVGIMLGGAVLFTKTVRKYDTGACIMIASVFGCIACACGSLACNIGTVIALLGVAMGLFTSVNILAAYSVINWTFIGNRKFALSILTFGSAIGQTVYPFITSSLIESYSWNGCLLILSAFAYLNGIPCGLVIYHSKIYFRKSDGRGGNESFMSFLTDGAFMVWILASFVLVLLGPVEQWFVVDVTVLKGFAAQSGVTLLSLNGIFGFLGRIICTVILKVYPNTRPELHIFYAFMFLAVAHVSVVASPVYWGMVLAMVVRGFSSSVIFSFSPSLLLDLRGPEQYPKTFAIEHMVMGIASVIGGYLSGFSVDVTGSYNLIFYIAAVGMVLGGVNSIIIFAILKMRKRLKCKYQSL